MIEIVVIDEAEQTTHDSLVDWFVFVVADNKVFYLEQKVKSENTVDKNI